MSVDLKIKMSNGMAHTDTAHDADSVDEYLERIDNPNTWIGFTDKEIRLQASQITSIEEIEDLDDETGGGDNR